jgi:hypothetical protein
MEFLNQVTYGNPTYEAKILLEKECIVRDLFPELIKDAFPKNDSAATKEELNEIVRSLKDLDETSPTLLRRYLNYDKALWAYINKMLEVEGIQENDLIQRILVDINPLILKLKYYFQRPRPYQLGNYYKLSLFPMKSTSALTPSYPSGHTIQSIVVLTIIGNKHPNIYQYCSRLWEDVAQSRVAIGVHYPSDNDFSYYVAQEILKHPKFAEKYQI